VKFRSRNVHGTKTLENLFLLEKFSFELRTPPRFSGSAVKRNIFCASTTLFLEGDILLWGLFRGLMIFDKNKNLVILAC
jgi:hypothetical protein